MQCILLNFLCFFEIYLAFIVNFRYKLDWTVFSKNMNRNLNIFQMQCNRVLSMGAYGIVILTMDTYKYVIIIFFQEHQKFVYLYLQIWIVGGTNVFILLRISPHYQKT